MDQQRQIDRRRSRSRERHRNSTRSRSRDRFHRNDNRDRDRPRVQQREKVIPLEALPRDPNLDDISDDPRVDGTAGGKIVKLKGGGRNTESFDPASTLVRPHMRIRIGKNIKTFQGHISHDDVIVVPNFFCEEEDWTIYYDLIKEMRHIQTKEESKDAKWISWHEGAHLISKNPQSSPSFQRIQNRISEYFSIPMTSVGTRFNWYRDSTDWKPFHHDSAAFNPQRARNQNITVGVSFGATRELAFLSALKGSEDTRIYFPQTNGMLFSFGRDVNIQWKHGINAVRVPLGESSEAQIDDRGRISIILWGQSELPVEEENSPPMLTENTRGFGHDMHNRNGNHDRQVRDDRHRDFERNRDVCRDFLRDRCSYGDRCRFYHPN